MEDNDGTGPQGFTRDGATANDFTDYDADAAEVEEELVNDEEEKSEEPDDGEDLDEQVDK